MLNIESPKRSRDRRAVADDIYPYYAGFSQTFAREILNSAISTQGCSLVFDPWSGSGTTQAAAAGLGLDSHGIDINPAMIVVGRARLLPSSEKTSLEPLCNEIIRKARKWRILPEEIEIDPLSFWFSKKSAITLRSIERSIAKLLTTAPTSKRKRHSWDLNEMSGIASSFYLALFLACRQLSSQFRSSNPTWLRIPRDGETKVDVAQEQIEHLFLNQIHRIKTMHGLWTDAEGRTDVRLSLGDATEVHLHNRADIVLGSPPYCTRIDYAASTRVELAVLHELLPIDVKGLSYKMIGTTRVPPHKLGQDPNWGVLCNNFLQALRGHPSKASAGYYYKTHLDYFEKIFRSIGALSIAMKTNAIAILVVQDSFYKDVHNDVPNIVVEMATKFGLHLFQRRDFHSNCISRINPRSRAYGRRSYSCEAVLCFTKVERVTKDKA